MRVVSIEGSAGIVESGSLRRRANFSLIKDVKKGDYVLLHAGFAIEKIDQAEAKKTIEMLKGL
jgi:hydrogenase expression/formation protein HypC